MAVPVFVLQSDLETRIGSDVVASACDFDGDGVADAAVIAGVIEDANRATESHLILKGFTRDQLVQLQSDNAVRRCACDLALGFLGRLRPEWIDSAGKGRYDAILTMAEKRLDLLAQGILRIPTEAEVGPNRSLVGAINVPDPQFTFAASSSKPRGPGGF